MTKYQVIKNFYLPKIRKNISNDEIFYKQFTSAIAIIFCLN